MKFIYNGNANKPGIYRITNTHTGRIYIGQASRFERRWYAHKKSLLTGRHRNKRLQRDYDKCKRELGNDDFLVFEVLEVLEGSTKQQRNECEAQYIANVWDNCNMCYNMRMRDYGDGVISTEVRKRLSDATKKLWLARSEEERVALAKRTGENNKKRWEAMTKEERSVLRKKMSEGLKKHWNATTEEERVAYGKRMHDGKKKRRDAMTEEERVACWKKQAEAQSRFMGTLVSPDGKEYDVVGISQFCREHGLIPSCIGRVLLGKLLQHKGWTKKLPSQQTNVFAAEQRRKLGSLT